MDNRRLFSLMIYHITLTKERIKMPIKYDTPEMGEQKPKAQIEIKLSHYGKHYYLTTPLELKGRGIKHLMTYTANDLHEKTQHKVGWHKYKATIRATEKLTEQYDMSQESLLD